MDAKTQAELDRVQLETAQLNLEEAKERNAARMQTKAVNERRNRERQNQLASEVHVRRTQAANCTHRQGGPPSDPLGGKGPTALNIVGMPDGFTELIMCSACRLRVFSPHPRNQSKTPRVINGETETAAEVKARLKKYEEDLERFTALRKRAKDEALTPEAATKMECGTTISVINSVGMPVYRERPCDSYPQWT